MVCRLALLIHSRGIESRDSQWPAVANCAEFQSRLVELNTEAQRLAGRPLLVTSPQDVSKALFVELQLKPPSWASKSARGHMPTGEGVLTAIRCGSRPHDRWKGARGACSP